MLRLGIVGGGIYGTNIIKAFKQCERFGLVEKIVVADIDEEKLIAHEKQYGIKGYVDYQEMLQQEELDAVAVATPDFLHREIAVTVAQAKKHVFVQKPLDVTNEGCKEIINAAQQNEVLLEVDFHKRYDPAHRLLEAAVASGELGTIQYGYAWMEDTIEVPTEWLKSWAGNSSPAWFLGVHYFDLIRWIIKSNPERVYATGVIDKLQTLGLGTYDSIQAKIDFENGAHFSFDCSWILPKSFESIVNQGLRIVGTKGIWEVDAQNRGIETCLEGSLGMRTLNPYFIREEKDTDGKTSYAGYGIESMIQFARHVAYLKQGGRLDRLSGMYASGDDGRIAALMALAVHESIRTGEIVECKRLGL